MASMAPYRATVTEVISRFGGNPARNGIIDGWLLFRKELRRRGLEGVQWVCGSFVEICEVQRGRPPGDVDVVTILDPSVQASAAVGAMLEPTLVGKGAKGVYSVDSYFIRTSGVSMRQVVREVSFWYGLFSHRRDDYLWKGIAEVPLRLSDTQ